MFQKLSDINGIIARTPVFLCLLGKGRQDSLPMPSGHRLHVSGYAGSEGGWSGRDVIGRDGMD